MAHIQVCCQLCLYCRSESFLLKLLKKLQKTKQVEEEIYFHKHMSLSLLKMELVQYTGNMMIYIYIYIHTHTHTHTLIYIQLSWKKYEDIILTNSLYNNNITKNRKYCIGENRIKTTKVRIWLYVLVSLTRFWSWTLVWIRFYGRWTIVSRINLPFPHSWCYPKVERELTQLCPSFIILFTNPSARAGCDTKSIFKRSLTGFNSEFSFS